METLQVKNLKKSYHGREILKGISFSVNRGEIFALLGMNGAGKTTTLECIEGIRRFDGGSIEVKGKRGIQLQSSSLPAQILPMEAVKLFSLWNHAEIDERLLEHLGIFELGTRKYQQLSTGQKRRLHLALALISKPDILFLDEPTAGLDVEARVALHEEIRRLAGMGKTIVLASHDMAEVEQLCDRIAILNEGRIVFLGTAQELSDRIHVSYTVLLETEAGKKEFQTEDILSDLLKELSVLKEAGLSLKDIHVDRGSMEEHFLELARRDQG